MACRPTEVTYQNRKHSSFGLAEKRDYQLDGFIEAVDLVHICGISLSLTDLQHKQQLLWQKKQMNKGKKFVLILISVLV